MKILPDNLKCTSPELYIWSSPSIRYPDIPNRCIWSASFYTTNPTERSTSESDLESSVESHRALAEQWPSMSVDPDPATQEVAQEALRSGAPPVVQP